MNVATAEVAPTPSPGVSAGSMFTPTDALKQNDATAEALGVSASGVASLLVTRVEEHGAVEFLLDGSVYRVEDEAVLRSILPDGVPVEQSTTEKPRRRSTQDFIKAQRAARAAASNAPSASAAASGSAKAAASAAPSASAPASEVTASGVALLQATASGVAKEMGVQANEEVSQHQVGENKWRRLLAADLGKLPAAGATTSLAEEMGSA